MMWCPNLQPMPLGMGFQVFVTNIQNYSELLNNSIVTNLLASFTQQAEIE